MQQNDEVKVTIWCITYNHMKYIRDAFDGMLEQKVNFKYKIVVYDDASTDGTSGIVREYANQYPDIFDITISEYNRYKDLDRYQFLLNLMRSKFTGKYIALCEGDDCWIDPLKLQRQVDFMEKNKKFSMYIHNCIWILYNENMKFKMQDLYNTSDDSMILMPENIILQEKAHPPTASFLMKRELFDLDDNFFLNSIGDYPLQLAALTEGEIFYDSRVMSIYRWKTPGSYSYRLYENLDLKIEHSFGAIKFLDWYNNYTELKYNPYIKSKIHSFLNLIINSSCIENINLYKEKIMKYLIINNILETNIIKYVNYYEMLSRLILDDVFLTKKITSFIENNTRIWIMGAGKFSKLLIKKLERCQIEYEGIVVSSYQGNPQYLNGKQVKSFFDLKNEEISVIIGINTVFNKDIEQQFVDLNIKKYIYAYDVF